MEVNTMLKRLFVFPAVFALSVFPAFSDVIIEPPPVEDIIEEAGNIPFTLPIILVAGVVFVTVALLLVFLKKKDSEG
jgi:hypothetical protein